MTPLQFYREQAAEQKAAADAAVLQNVRERCQRASDAWTALAAKSERVASQRLASQAPCVADENPKDALMAAATPKGRV